MEETVYVDILFLINFSMDFLCFFLTSRLLCTPFWIKRVLFASIFGGVYACASLFLNAGGVMGVGIDIIAAFFMCGVAVWKRGMLRETLGFGIVYAAISMLLGGLMTALFSLFNRLGIDRLLGTEEESKEGISVWLFVILAAISGGAALLGGSFFKKSGTRREGRLELEYKNRTIEIKALCDSGNLLTDPISGKPCVIVDSKEMERLLSHGAVGILKSGRVELLDSEMAMRVRAVPASTVSGDTVLYAIRVDRVRIDMGDGRKDVDVLIALGDIGESADGARALLPSSVVFGVI